MMGTGQVEGRGGGWRMGREEGGQVECGRNVEEWREKGGGWGRRRRDER